MPDKLLFRAPKYRRRQAEEAKQKTLGRRLCLKDEVFNERALWLRVRENIEAGILGKEKREKRKNQ